MLMMGTVTKYTRSLGLSAVWVQLDGDCKVPLLPDEFKRLGREAKVGMRVEVAVGDIDPYLVRVLTVDGTVIGFGLYLGAKIAWVELDDGREVSVPRENLTVGMRVEVSMEPNPHVRGTHA